MSSLEVDFKDDKKKSLMGNANEILEFPRQ
jgi:hypothetical protein